MTQKDNILSYVNILLQNGNVVIDSDCLSFLVDDFMQEVLIYCNREDLPVELERITAKIIFAYIQSGSTTTESGARVSSISEDGRTVNFDLNGIVIDSKNQIYATTLLNRFKKLYRVRSTD